MPRDRRAAYLQHGQRSVFFAQTPNENPADVLLRVPISQSVKWEDRTGPSLEPCQPCHAASHRCCRILSSPHLPQRHDSPTPSTRWLFLMVSLTQTPGVPNLLTERRRHGEDGPPSAPQQPCVRCLGPDSNAAITHHLPAFGFRLLWSLTLRGPAGSGREGRFRQQAPPTSRQAVCPTMRYLTSVLSSKSFVTHFTHR